MKNATLEALIETARQNIHTEARPHLNDTITRCGTAEQTINGVPVFVCALPTYTGVTVAGAPHSGSTIYLSINTKRISKAKLEKLLTA